MRYSQVAHELKLSTAAPIGMLLPTGISLNKVAQKAKAGTFLNFINGRGLVLAKTYIDVKSPLANAISLNLYGINAKHLMKVLRNNHGGSMDGSKLLYLVVRIAEPLDSEGEE